MDIVAVYAGKYSDGISKISHWPEFFVVWTDEQFIQISVNEYAMGQVWSIIKKLSVDV